MEQSIYDNRNNPIVDVEQGYGEWSHTYEQIVQDEMDLRLLNQIERVDWSASKEIIDLACGTGRIGVWLRQRTSATIDGVDITPEMLEKAHAKNVYRNLYHASITDTGLGTSTYDLALQSLADEHLKDLRPLYAEVARITKPGGVFVLVGFHPHFLMTGMPTHYERESGEPTTIRTYVHLISDHVKTAHLAGWSLVEMNEGLIDEQWLLKKPKWEKYFGLPISFVMAWMK
jgi:SAM-dependent methyltransferase